MREIKFRGKSVNTGECVYGSLIARSDGTNYIVEDWDTDYPDDITAIEVNEVCEFTGEKDEHGKDIYEGDNLEFAYRRKRVCGQVKYGHIGFYIDSEAFTFGKPLHDIAMFCKPVYVI